jgi:hypothetical protein
VAIDEYAAVEAWRAWAYLQLARTYGGNEVGIPFYTEPLTAISQIREENFPKLTLSQIVAELAPSLERFAGLLPPNFGQTNYNIGTTNWGQNKAVNFHRIFVPVDIVLGEMYLEDGQWLKVTAEAGKLTFVGDLNYKGERETVVTVEQGWKPVQFTVTQDMVNLVTFEVPEMNDRDAFTVECEPTEYMAMTSGNWEVQSPNDWITVTKNETGCTVEVAENNSGAVRTSEVNVLVDGEVLMTYTFKQKIYSYNFFLGEWTFSYDSGTTIAVTVRENVKGESYYMDGLYCNNIVLGYSVVDDVPTLTLHFQWCPGMPCIPCCRIVCSTRFLR